MPHAARAGEKATAREAQQLANDPDATTAAKRLKKDSEEAERVHRCEAQFNIRKGRRSFGKPDGVGSGSSGVGDSGGSSGGGGGSGGGGSGGGGGGGGDGGSGGGGNGGDSSDVKKHADGAATDAEAADGAYQRADNEQYLSWYVCDGMGSKAARVVCVRAFVWCLCVCAYVCMCVSECVCVRLLCVYGCCVCVRVCVYWSVCHLPS
jgi:hypothetical protein